MKGVIIKRERSGRWYATFQVEDEPEPLPENGREIGIDVGVRHYLTDSDGRRIENPRVHASWGRFFQMLSYKAERAGRTVVGVDPRGTSQTIAEGFDRDYIAARRILSLGPGRPESTPVEMEPLLSVPASAVVAGQVPSLNQEASCESWG